jgi:hypothetical protein
MDPVELASFRLSNMFLLCSSLRLKSALLKFNRRRDVAIEHRRCGGPTILGTMIKLRRGVLGFHETRSQAAYCGTCKLSVPIEDTAAMRRPGGAEWA